MLPFLVVFYSEPLVEGITFNCLSSGVVAIRRALPNALKTVSA